MRIFASVLRVIWGVANQLQETGSHLFCQKRVGVLIYKHQLCQLNDVMIRLTNAHTPSHSKVSNGTLAGSQINPADAKPRERFEGLLNRTVRIIRRPRPSPRQGRRLGPPEVWNLLCHGHGVPFNPSAGLSKATLAATRSSHLFLVAFKHAVCPPSASTKHSGHSSLCC